MKEELERLDDVLNSMRVAHSRVNLGYKYPEDFWVRILGEWIQEMDTVLHELKSDE